jgi:hypothetical protein
MPIKTASKLEKAPTWFMTGPDVPPVVWQDCVQSVRTRSWNNAFPNRKSMLQSLLANGYLPTQGYTDDLQDVIRSKNVVLTGKVINQPNYVFTISWIPLYNRVSVNPLTDPLVATQVSKITSRLQSKIVGQGTNLPVSLMEAKQTIGMVGDCAQKLYTAYRHVRHGKFKAAALALGLERAPRTVSARKSAESNWLEYRYGWRLVVMDASSLMKTVWNELRDRPHTLRVNAYESAESKTSSAVAETKVMPNQAQALAWTANIVTTRTTSTHGGYVYSIENQAVSAQQSFGLLNPFVIAWELIPYSFVVDWFANVGECLQGLNAFVGKSCLDGYLVRCVEASTEVYWTNVRKGSGVFSVNTPLPTYYSGKIVERRFNRQRIFFTPATLRLEFDMNVGRALDAIALVTQRKK